MIVQLISKGDEQVHFYEEDNDSMVAQGEELCILSWNQKVYAYEDGRYSDAWGDYLVYKEANLVAVPTSIEVA